jgi:hypothetical protein
MFLTRGSLLQEDGCTYIQLCYGTVYMQQYKQSTYKTTYTAACKTRYTTPVYTSVFLKMKLWIQNT